MALCNLCKWCKNIMREKVSTNPNFLALFMVIYYKQCSVLKALSSFINHPPELRKSVNYFWIATTKDFVNLLARGSRTVLLFLFTLKIKYLSPPLMFLWATSDHLIKMIVPQILELKWMYVFKVKNEGAELENKRSDIKN